MAECSECNAYCKKGFYSGTFCKLCAYEASRSPPGSNSIMMQYESKFKKIQDYECSRQRFLCNASLIDIAAEAVLDDMESLKIAFQILPDGNAQWHAILRAWYRLHRHKGRQVSSEPFPKMRLAKLLNIRLEQSIL